MSSVNTSRRRRRLFFGRVPLCRRLVVFLCRALVEPFSCHFKSLPMGRRVGGERKRTPFPPILPSRVLYLSTCVCIHTVLLLTWRHAPMNRSFTQSFVLHSCTTLTFLPFLLPSFFLSFFFSPPVSVSHCAQRTLRRQEGNT